MKDLLILLCFALVMNLIHGAAITKQPKDLNTATNDFIRDQIHLHNICINKSTYYMNLGKQRNLVYSQSKHMALVDKGPLATCWIILLFPNKQCVLDLNPNALLMECFHLTGLSIIFIFNASYSAGCFLSCHGHALVYPAQEARSFSTRFIQLPS